MRPPHRPETPKAKTENNLTLLRTEGPIDPDVLLRLAMNWEKTDILVIGITPEGLIQMGASDDRLDNIVATLHRALAFALRQYPQQSA